MGKYSIKELEQLSGIKAHTIRIWEKRHKLINPSRTPTNIRFYSDADLKKIINVSLLNNHGLKISRIAGLTMEEMNRRVLALSETRTDISVDIDQLVIAMIDMDEVRFEQVLSNLILRYGFEKSITDIVYPFLEKIGVLWQTQNITPAHEHFISNLIRQKIIVAIDSLSRAPATPKKILLFLPEGEMHEMGLLFYHYLARRAGHHTFYFGQNLPHDDLLQVYNIHKPHILVTSIISPPAIPVGKYIQKLARSFPSATILISGLQAKSYRGTRIRNIRIFDTATELTAILEP